MSSSHVHRVVLPALACGCVVLAGQLGACAASNGGNDIAAGGQGGFSLGTAGEGGSGGGACASFDEQAVIKPVNLYVMFDKSSSMAGNKWDSAKAGLAAFVDDPNSAGMKVALRFFPRDPDATPVCDQVAYRDPVVPFGELNGHAAAIKNAMDAEAPDGFSTPIWPALGGAILKGIEVAMNSPGETSAVLLVTDGVPQGPAATCSGINPEDPAEIAALANTGATYNPPVVTYVVGLPGVDQSIANQIAAAGGTDSAILVSNTNVQEEFRQALTKVRGDALPCRYEIPAGVTEGNVTIAQVNIEVTPGGGGEPYVVPQNPSCNGEGWRYDDPLDPTAIELCPDTCNALKADLEAGIKILLGCATVLK